MITKQTVFVLGAGASMPYGFPSGMDLLNTLRGRLGQPGKPGVQEFVELLRATDHSDEEIEALSAGVWRCGRMSVDAFLEGRRELWPVGKSAIAAALIPYEQERALFGAKQDDWYRYLFSRLSDGITAREFSNNRLAVITYNYDRSFEHFLFEALTHSYGLDCDEAVEIAANLPIVHVHGSLGALPWQDGDWHRAYSMTCKADAIEGCRDQIRIIAEEDLDGGTEYERARELLCRADVVAFLGFGYHKVNIDRLRVSDWALDVRIHGTAYGTVEDERSRARRMLRNGLDVVHEDARITDLLRTRGQELLGS